MFYYTIKHPTPLKKKTKIPSLKHQFVASEHNKNLRSIKLDFSHLNVYLLVFYNFSEPKTIPVDTADCQHLCFGLYLSN